MSTHSTSWGNVADWYDDLLAADGDTFQAKVILPNLRRLLSIQKGQKILDLACGQGFFAREFALAGATVVGADIAPELVARAKARVSGVKFIVAPAHRVSAVADQTMDVVTIILALQNIENVAEVFRECARVLQPGGHLALVLNHPAFRVPRSSGWGWDEKKLIEYRRIDQYLAEAKIKIDMHPGEKKRQYTVSFHRPLQVYFKHLAKAGFAVTKLEEWISHRPPPKGRVFAARDRARKEIPLFMYLEAIRRP
ncbi:MAG: class I SAM-dependent methyltransferase [Candidatus Magasanikbacteria bacterium]|nr:class I SAM-dependent methyltransferase [Candidatus Magasanikbacteria bacterium]